MQGSTRTTITLKFDDTLWHRDEVKGKSRYETPAGTKHSRWRLVSPEVDLRDGLDLPLCSQSLLRHSTINIVKNVLQEP